MMQLQFVKLKAVIIQCVIHSPYGTQVNSNGGNMVNSDFENYATLATDTLSTSYKGSYVCGRGLLCLSFIN